jgi:multidrug efflux system membrane fusion protein
MTRAIRPESFCVAALAGFMMLGVVACNQASTVAPAPLPVHTATAQSVDVQNGTKYSANIVPYAQVTLSFQSAGYINHIRQVKNSGGGMRNIDPGDRVLKGTVLAEVRPQDYVDKLQQAKAQLGRASADQKKATQSFDRVKALYASQSATKPDYDSAKAQLDSANSSVSGAQAQISEAKTALGYCYLKAPFNGWLVSRNVDLGTLVGPATNGFVIADTSSVKAVFGVPDTYINRVKPGQRLTVTTDSLPYPITGRVSAISPAADQKSRVFSVEVTLPNPKNELKSGMIASLTLAGDILPHSIIAVPLSAVIRDPGRPDGFAVMTAEGSSDLVKAQLHPMELGETYGNMIAIKGGISPGERVITSGVTLIKSGDQVRIIP